MNSRGCHEIHGSPSHFVRLAAQVFDGLHCTRRVLNSMRGAGREEGAYRPLPVDVMVKRMEAWEKAREILADVTPLKRDCGRLCGARCCASLEGEETGMLLFPGEEDAYEEMDGWRIVPADRELLLICPGECDRKDRPLACRMFPLLPWPVAGSTEAAQGGTANQEAWMGLRKERQYPPGAAKDENAENVTSRETVTVTLDERSRAVCPLARAGKKGMDPAFVQAVAEAGKLLMQDEKQRKFLLRLADEQEALRDLRKRLGGGLGARS